jgi:hypothetical protein
MVVRIDDVNANTDFTDLYAQIELLSDLFDEIILGVNLISRSSDSGAVYPDLPLRNQIPTYFYDVDRTIDYECLESLSSFPKVSIVSHGLIHTKHGELSADAVAMSILTSCSLLGTKRFIPPFNNTSFVVKNICDGNGIELIGNNETTIWHSLETDKFNPLYPTWYYHPWRMTTQELSEKLGVRV